MADMCVGLLSPWLRNLRFENAKAYVADGGRVLDFACGIGLFAEYCRPEAYIGVDSDAQSVEIARARFPGYSFTTSLDDEKGRFDTIVMLAFIEHIPDPVQFLSGIKKYLSDGGCFVMTTPHPSGESLYHVLSRIGICSRAADDQHHTLLNRKGLAGLAQKLGMEMTCYRRFLFGLNQMAVFRERSA